MADHREPPTLDYVTPPPPPPRRSPVLTVLHLIWRIIFVACLTLGAVALLVAGYCSGAFS